MQTIAIDVRIVGKKRTGDETVFLELTRELLKLDTESRYLLLTDETDPEILADLRARFGSAERPRTELVSLPSRNRFDWNLRVVPRYLSETPVDVFHTQYILPFFLPKRLKVVNHIHDVSFRAYPHLIGWKDRLFLALLIPRSLARADAIVTPSRFTKDEISRWYGTDKAKIHVIENAVREREIAPRESEKLRARYGLPEHFILYLGTLQPRKNIPFLIRAFARLEKRLPGYGLVLAGNRQGHHFDRGIDRAVKEEGVSDRVVFPGYIDAEDLLPLLQMARVFAFPSLYEGFGIPVLEAFLAGTPVAASDIPALREAAGSGASFFDPKEVASCSEVLYALCVDDRLRQELKAQGKERFRLFSWAQSAQKLRALYGVLSASH